MLELISLSSLLLVLFIGYVIFKNHQKKTKIKFNFMKG